MAKKSPDLAKYNKAIKLLEQFERLAKKLRLDLPGHRLEELRKRRDSGTINSGDLPAKMAREFPEEFVGMSLEALRQASGKKS